MVTKPTHTNHGTFDIDRPLRHMVLTDGVVWEIVMMDTKGYAPIGDLDNIRTNVFPGFGEERTALNHIFVVDQVYREMFWRKLERDRIDRISEELR